MASTAEIIVDYIANTSGLSKATGDIESSGGRLKSAFGGVAKAVGAGLAVGAVTTFAKASVQAAQESVVATSRLDAVFKAMGDTTGTASKQAQDYASSLSKQIGVEDEVIMQGQALLATFKSVSSETGRAAGIFDRATAAAADLAAAGFGSIESNSVQLGKALENPLKGITALAKAGVTFTEAQKAQIKALEESGHHLEAQKIVLAAVEGQVKGTAAATATESQKMAVAFGEVQESVGMALLPILNELAPLLAQVAGFIADNVTWIAPLIAGLAGLAAIIKVVTLAQVAWNLVMTANPIGLIIIGIAALIAAIVLLWKNWDSVTKLMTAAWKVLQTTATNVWNAIKSNVSAAMTAIKTAVTTGWNAIQSVVTTVVNAIRGVVTALTNAFNSNKTIATVLAAFIGGPLVAAIIVARAAFNNLDGIVDGVKAGLNAVRTAASSVASFLKGTLSNAADSAKGALQGLVGAASGIAGVFNSAASAVRSLVSAIQSIPSRIHVPSIPHIPGLPFAAPPIPELMAGGIVSRPTLALIGEGAGREIVTPERLLRSIVAEGGGTPNVRVFIGDTELRGLVRVEVDDATTGLARTLLAGARS